IDCDHVVVPALIQELARSESALCQSAVDWVTEQESVLKVGAVVTHLRGPCAGISRCGGTEYAEQAVCVIRRWEVWICSGAASDAGCHCVNHVLVRRCNSKCGAALIDFGEDIYPRAGAARVCIAEDV